jgi:hypothetical protein
MVTFGLIGDFKTLSYVGGSGYCAFAKGMDATNAATIAANAGGSWKNYMGISSERLFDSTRAKSREQPGIEAVMKQPLAASMTCAFMHSIARSSRYNQAAV